MFNPVKNRLHVAHVLRIIIMETILVKKRKNAKKAGCQKIQVNAQTIPLEKVRKIFVDITKT